MKSIDAKNEFIKGGKKVLAVILAGSTLVGTSVVIAKNVKKSDEKPETEVSTTMVEEEILELSKSFDINDQSQVTKRAKAINALEDNKYETLDIINLIYIFNGKYDKVEFSSKIKTDEEKYDYLQHLNLLIHVIMNVDTLEDINKVRAYMLQSKKVDEDQTKENNIEVAKLINTQYENLAKKDEKALVETAETLLALVKNIMKNWEDYTDYEKLLMLEELTAKSAIITPYLQEKDAKFWDDLEYEKATYTNTLFYNIVEVLKIDLDWIYKNQQDGKFGNKTTPLTEAYKPADKEVAKDEPIPNPEGTTTVIEQGGKPVPNSNGKQEVIKESVTEKVEEEEFIVDISGIEKPLEKTEEGGKVVEEFTTQVSGMNDINKDDYKEEVNKSDEEIANDLEKIIYVDSDLSYQVEFPDGYSFTYTK